MKLPNQQLGRVVRRHVRTIDVLPTIAAVAHVRPDWRVEGRSVVGRAARRIPSSTLVVQRSGNVIRVSPGSLRRRAAAALRLKLRLFGSGDSQPGLFGIGPAPAMHGTAVNHWRVVRRGGTRVRVDLAAGYRQVAPRLGVVPAKVMGRLSGSPEAGGGRDRSQ